MKDDEGIYIYKYILIVVSPIKWLGGNLYLIILDFPIGSTEYVIINYMCIDLMIISIGYQTLITVL